MKKLVLLFVLFSLQVFAQEVQTTEDEYNYLTKEYAFGLKYNYPVKEGYELVKLDEKEWAPFSFKAYRFIEKKSNATKAILFVLKKAKNEPELLCLPINNETLCKKFTVAKQNLGLTMGLNFYYFYDPIISKLINSK